MPSLDWDVEVGDLPEPAQAPFVPFLEQDDLGPVQPGTGTKIALVGQVAAFPFEIDGSGDVRMVTDEDAIFAEIQQVLGIEAASGVTMGELEWDPEKGSLVNRLRHMNSRNPATLGLARELVGRALERYVTSVVVKNINIRVEDSSDGTTGSTMRIRVQYVVRSRGTTNVVEVTV